MSATLEGGEWSAAHPGRTLPPGKTRYPFYRRLGGPQGRSGRAENLVLTGIRSRTVQPVAQSLYRLSHRAHKYGLCKRYYLKVNKIINKEAAKGNSRTLSLNISVCPNYVWVTTLTVPATKTNSLMIFTKIINVYCKSRTKQVNKWCGQSSEL